MKIPKIQTQNCYKSKNIPTVKSQDNSVNFQAYKFNKDYFTAKKNLSVITKIGAMATAAAVSMKELFFNNVLDVSTVGQIKQNAICFGESIAENIHRNNGEFNQKEVEKLVLTHLGEEQGENVCVVTNEEEFCDFAEENMKLDREYAKSVFQKAEGLAAHSSSGKIMFLLKLEGKEPEVATHIATHEFEHLLYKTSGFVGKLIKKYLSDQANREEMDKSIATSGESDNKKFFALQNALTGLLLDKDVTSTPFEYVEQAPTLEGIIELSPNLTSKEDLDKWLGSYVRKNLIYPEFDDSNFAELQGIEMVLRDEARAYEAGGKAQKYYNKLTGQNIGKTTMAEMVAVIYNEMADKIQEYKKLIIQNSLKKSLGMKYINYHEPTSKDSSSLDKDSGTKNS